MKVYHVSLAQEDDWYCAIALEDSAVFTQGRSLDEIIVNIREVAELMYGEKDVQVELIVPPELAARRARKSAIPRKRAKQGNAGQVRS